MLDLVLDFTVGFQTELYYVLGYQLIECLIVMEVFPQGPRLVCFPGFPPNDDTLFRLRNLQECVRQEDLVELALIELLAVLVKELKSLAQLFALGQFHQLREHNHVDVLIGKLLHFHCPDLVRFSVL